METEKRKRFIIDFLYFAIILAIAIFVCRFGLLAILPFVIAFVVFLLIKPVVRFLTEKCRVQHKVAGLLCTVLFYATVGVLVTLVCVKLLSTVKGFVVSLPSLYSDTIEPFLVSAFEKLDAFAQRLNPTAAAAYDAMTPKLIVELEDVITATSRRLLTDITGYALSLPKLLLNALITVIATVFLANSWAEVKAFVLRQLSPRWRGLAHDIRVHLGKTLWRYTRSYALILAVTFLELAVGLSIVGVEGALRLALIIALFDILPVVGSGMVLFPWALITLLSGDYMRALGLGIVYVVIIVVRNIMEPKIIGEKVGLHPLVTLLSMVVGVYVFGPIGLLGLPLTLALVQSLNEQGVVHLYKKKPRPACESAPEPPAGAAVPDEGTGEAAAEQAAKPAEKDSETDEGGKLGI